MVVVIKQAKPKGAILNDLVSGARCQPSSYDCGALR